MEQQELLRILFFFNEIEKKAKDEIRKTGMMNAAIYGLTDKTENGRNTVAATMIPNFIEKEGIEFLMAAAQLAYGMKSFINEVEKKEDAKVVAIFHCELMQKDGEERLFTMRKYRKSDDDSEGDVKIFKVVRGETTVDEEGNVLIPEMEFVMEDE
jgi:hypothetical protein